VPQQAEHVEWAVTPKGDIRTPKESPFLVAVDGPRGVYGGRPVATRVDVRGRQRAWVVVARTNKFWYPPFDELRARTIGGQLEVVRHTPSVLVYRVEERVTGQ
jgi:hypothetical protein